jgi:AraC family transcriptional regulator
VRVRVSQFGAFRYVYRRIFEPYGNTKLVDAYHDLIAWVAARGTDIRDVSVIGMSLDDPSVTPSEKCRYDLGVAFPRAGNPLPTRAECDRSEFSIRDFESQKIAAIHCAGDGRDVGRAWHYLYRVWLPSAAFDPADLPAMEIFVRLPEEIGWETFDLQACIPVVRR